MLRIIICVIFGLKVVSLKAQYQICYVYEADEVLLSKLDSNVLRHWKGRVDSVKIFFTFLVDDSVDIFLNHKFVKTFYIRHNYDHTITESIIFPEQTDSAERIVNISIRNKCNMQVELKKQYNSIIVQRYSEKGFNVCYRKGVFFSNGHQTWIW